MTTRVREQRGSRGHGNTGAASVPIALGEYLLLHPAEVGDHFLMVAFGGGRMSLDGRRS